MGGVELRILLARRTHDVITHHTPIHLAKDRRHGHVVSG